MKKNYLEPVLEVQSIALQSMIANSFEMGIETDPTTGDAPIKDFEDISSDLFGNESFGTAEEW